MSISPFLTINCPCDEALQWAKAQLSKAGMRPVQTFDLHLARAGLDICLCPHHGTEDCDCQMVVLLVYGSEEHPVSLILHGNDGQTQFSITDLPDQKTESVTIHAIRQVLEINTPLSPSPVKSRFGSS